MDSHCNGPRPGDPGALALYVAFSYVAVLATTFSFLREVEIRSALQAAFLGAAWLSYGFIYLLPVLVPLLVLALLLRWRAVRRVLAVARISPRLALFVPAVLLPATALIFLYADRHVFHLYGFHMNGFVLNLVTTPGGIESLGSSGGTQATFVFITLGFVALQCLFAVLSIWLAGRRRAKGNLLGKGRIALAMSLIVMLAAAERITYSLCEVRAYQPVLTSANVLPYYLPLHFEGLADFLGLERVERSSFNMGTQDLRLNYPLKPLVRRPQSPRHNIVWLVSESLRSDMLTPEIMPETHALATRSAWFRNHVSGGNGTRMGVFSMFYGLHGPYWFPFLDERRGPVLIDELKRDDYQFGLYTSARFTYPEFDATVFSAVPSSALTERSGTRKEGWVRDRENVEDLLGFIDRRDRDRPFMTFLFFESPHSHYYFPPESVIREPYAKDVNYATTDFEKDAGLLFNRYVNSCHHLDSQIGRILRYLGEHELMDDTIVVVTGDHGEEFMERGRWGHNSNYVREQIQVPLVLHVPGRGAQSVDRLTSHVDIPVTVLTALGVTNPPGDYALGHDLFGDVTRSDAVVAGWDDLVYIDDRSFAVFPLKGHQLWQQRYCTRDGDPIPDADAWLAAHRTRLREIMRELKRFSR